MDATISYYNQNALEYFVKTVNVPMQNLYDKFEIYLKSGDKILDLGCGSGRDSKYFLSKGYDVVSVDGSIEICRLAEKYIGKYVRNIFFDELDYVNEFDAVWASASLLHVDSKDMKDVLYRIKSALKKNGLMYASWKYGQGEKVDSLRYYVDFDEYAIKKILSIVSIEIQSIWITEDKLLRGCKWLNVIGKSV